MDTEDKGSLELSTIVQRVVRNKRLDGWFHEVATTHYEFGRVCYRPNREKCPIFEKRAPCIH